MLKARSQWQPESKHCLLILQTRIFHQTLIPVNDICPFLQRKRIFPPFFFEAAFDQGVNLWFLLMSLIFCSQMVHRSKTTEFELPVIELDEIALSRSLSQLSPSPTTEIRTKNPTILWTLSEELYGAWCYSSLLVCAHWIYPLFKSAPWHHLTWKPFLDELCAHS